VPGLAAADRQPDRQVGFLAGAGWAEEDHVLLAGDEVQGGQMHDLVAFQAAGVVEVEFLDAFAGREPGGSDPAFAKWASRAAILRCRQAAKYSSWVHDSLRARSASRPADSRRVGAFNARVR